MDILMSETCWAHKKWNKIASDIKLVFYSSNITMMHGPINIRYFYLLDHFPSVYVCYTNQWDLYFEIALSLKPNDSVTKCLLILFKPFSVLVLFASSVSIVCAHHLRDIIMEQRLFWTMSHFTFCLYLYSCVFHELQTVFWFVNGQNNINTRVISAWWFWGHWLQIKATSNLMFLILTTNIYRFLCICIYHPTIFHDLLSEEGFRVFLWHVSCTVRISTQVNSHSNLIFFFRTAYLRMHL